MGKYFSLSSLPTELKEGLESRAVDFGAAMMSGVESNILGAATAAGNVVDGAVGQAEGLVGTAMTTAMNAPDFALQLASTVFDDMTNQVATYMGNVVADLMKFPTPADIMASAQKQLSAYIKSPGDLMKELTTPCEDILKESADKEKENKLKNFISKTQEKVGKAKEKVQEILDTANSYIGIATQYVEQGPQWVTEQIDIAETMAMDQVQEKMGSLMEEVNKKKQLVIDKIGEGVAKVMAEPINNAQKKTLAKQLQKVEVTKQKGITKAKAAIGAALLKVMALVGA